LHSGFTPLVRAHRLAERLGVGEIYVKDDSVNHPTCSYKDRVVSIAATRAIELGFTVFSCASTGNLAGSVASHAARLGLDCYVFIPDDLEAGKVAGASIYRPKIVAVRGTLNGTTGGSQVGSEPTRFQLTSTLKGTDQFDDGFISFTVEGDSATISTIWFRRNGQIFENTDVVVPASIRIVADSSCRSGNLIVTTITTPLENLGRTTITEQHCAL
jgi:hypothetical protein